MLSPRKLEMYGILYVLNSGKLKQLKHFVLCFNDKLVLSSVCLVKRTSIHEFSLEGDNLWKSLCVESWQIANRGEIKMLYRRP